MGECINLRRGGEKKKLPVLDPNFPADMRFMARGGHVTLEVRIAEHGNPADYTYKWYWGDGNDFRAESSPYFNFTNIQSEGTHYIYCEVTNKAGTVRSRVATITVMNTYLLWLDDHITNKSGGWHLSSALQVGVGSGVQGALYHDSEKHLTLELPYASGATRDGYARTGNAIDLTPYKTIRFTMTMYTSNTSYLFKVGATTQPYNAYSYVAAQTTVTSSGWHTVDVDVSGLSGAYYIGVFGHVYGESAYAKIANVQLLF